MFIISDVVVVISSIWVYSTLCVSYGLCWSVNQSNLYFKMANFSFQMQFHQKACKIFCHLEPILLTCLFLGLCNGKTVHDEFCEPNYVGTCCRVLSGHWVLGSAVFIVCTVILFWTFSRKLLWLWVDYWYVCIPSCLWSRTLLWYTYRLTVFP